MVYNRVLAQKHSGLSRSKFGDWQHNMGLEKSTSGEGGAPPDVGNLALLTYFGLGVGYLLPWNAFITAVDYFDYLYPNSHIDRVFTVAYLIPGLITLSLVLAYGKQTSSRIRTNTGLVLLLMSLLIVPVVDALLIHGDEERIYSFAHVVTVGAVALAGIGDALVQASVIGAAGELPDRYMQAIVSGTAVCGVLVSFLRILTKAALPQNARGLRASANFYFVVSAGFLILSTILFNRVHKLAVMIHFEGKKNAIIAGKPEAEAVAATQDLETDSSTLLIKATNVGDETYASRKGLSSVPEEDEDSIMGVLVPLKWLAVSFVLIYIITLSIFPGFLAEDVHSSFLKDWYPILLIAIYNVFDLVGKLGTSIYKPKTQSVTVIGSVARILFFPLFAACLHGPAAFRTEAPVFLLTAMLGVTNGYFTTTGFIIATKIVPFAQAERAGVIMVLGLVVGLTLGSLVSWVWVI